MNPDLYPKRCFNSITGTKILKLTVSIAACLSAGVIGSFFTTQSVASWYLTIQKPPITPPDWIFAPVWTLLYVLMGIAFFLIWIKNLETLPYKHALMIFSFQLLLNVLWSIVFFGCQWIAGGLVVITALWGTILWTIKAFFFFSKTASLLLVPYIIWVGYAVLLNGWIFFIN